MKRLLDPRMARNRYGRQVVVALLMLTAACTSIGPSAQQIVRAPASSAVQGIQVIDVDDALARSQATRLTSAFIDTLGQSQPMGQIVGVGDVLDISIWEAPPAVLFGTVIAQTSAETSRATSLPHYLVGPSGRINVPFAGSVPVAGRTLNAIEADIVARLSGKAHLPQAIVRMDQNMTATVSVVGDVNNSTRMPLTPKGETILDAITAAGGTKEQASKMTIQISRAGRIESMPLDAVIRDPRQNIVLRPGDVVTAFYQPYSFTVLGAAGRNQELNFEATGITLAQALGRVGGLQDGRADPKGTFLFRWEDPSVVANGATAPHRADGRVPVIYRINMKDPATYFAMQSFPVRNGDVLYVANSWVADFQRFLSIVVGVANPAISYERAINNN